MHMDLTTYLILEDQEMEMQELEKRFTYHPPKADQSERHRQLRDGAKAMAFQIHELCPESREKDLAVMMLEEVVFWANAAIARRE